MGQPLIVCLMYSNSKKHPLQWPEVFIHLKHEKYQRHGHLAAIALPAGMEWRGGATAAAEEKAGSRLVYTKNYLAFSLFLSFSLSFSLSLSLSPFLPPHARYL